MKDGVPTRECAEVREQGNKEKERNESDVGGNGGGNGLEGGLVMGFV